MGIILSDEFSFGGILFGENVYRNQSDRITVMTTHCSYVTNARIDGEILTLDSPITFDSYSHNTHEQRHQDPLSC